MRASLIANWTTDVEPPPPPPFPRPPPSPPFPHHHHLHLHLHLHHHPDPEPPPPPTQYQSYELQRIYWQGTIEEGAVERRDVPTLDAAAPPELQAPQKYLVLFNPGYHAKSGPVVVRPDEVTIVTLMDEVLDSAWLAIPGFFWVIVAWNFYQYGKDMGRL